MSLSDKIKEEFMGTCVSYIRASDVKDFIKLAREMLDDCMSGGCDRELVLSDFDKLAGDDLK